MPSLTNGTAQNGADHTAGRAVSDGELEKLRQRFEYARFAENMKNEIIENLLTNYDTLVQTHKSYVEEHQQEREAARAALSRADGMQRSIDYLQRLLDRDPFVVVLIDGNNMIFHNNFLKHGETGGMTAANAVNHAILDWARAAIPETPEDTKVVVRIYANVKAIAEACAKAGIIDHSTRVEEFVHGFTSANSLFDFTDVGSVKDVDGKVVESLKLYLYNYYCRHILLGCGTGDHYASTLQHYMHDKQAKGRITLLEGPPMSPELSSLSFNTKKFPGMFRETKLVLPVSVDLHAASRTRLGSNTSLNAASSIFTPRTNTPTNVSSPLGSVTSIDQHALPGRPIRRLDSADDSASDAGSGTWAVVTSKNAHRPLKDLISPAKGASLPTIYRNKKGQRVDIAMDYDRNEVQRVKRLKACNQHYIGIGCCHYNAGKADKCPHSHSYNFSTADLKTLRVVARETPCKKGHDCDDPKCIYGHQCPFPAAVEGSMRGSGFCLNGEGCRFPASMHGMDTTAMKITKITGV